MKTPCSPLWKGPQEDGITYSLLCKFLECRERFRLLVIEGLSEDEGFRDVIEYGSMWHTCEEHYRRSPRSSAWQAALHHYCQTLLKKYPESQAAIEKWKSVCLVQFPIYIQYWLPDHLEQNRKSVCEEVDFRLPYTLPSGRTITLRGKIDGILLVIKSLMNQENKTKGKIDEEALLKTLHGNLQTMFYQIACRIARHTDTEIYFGKGPYKYKVPKNSVITGVNYNVVRRPLGDFQKHSIRPRKGESQASFLHRLGEEIKANLDFFFMRWEITLSEDDVTLFKQRTFDPILEQLCDWWEYIAQDPFDPWSQRNSYSLHMHRQTKVTPLPNNIHWQSPWGVYNALATGTRGSYFNYLTTGDRSGLTKVNTLFPELTPAA